MIVRVNSHRVRAKLLSRYPEARSVYLREKMESGYYVLPHNADITRIKGLSKSRIQDETKYARTWNRSS